MFLLPKASIILPILSRIIIFHLLESTEFIILKNAVSKGEIPRTYFYNTAFIYNPKPQIKKKEIWDRRVCMSHQFSGWLCCSLPRKFWKNQGISSKLSRRTFSQGTLGAFIGRANYRKGEKSWKRGCCENLIWIFGQNSLVACRK